MSVTTQVDLLQNRRTKIIATIGPASDSEEMLEALILAGVNVFRLNMSHGGHAGHRQVFERIQKVSGKLDLPVGVLADLCGPKIRTGRFQGDAMDLVEGAAVTVSTSAELGGEGLIVSQYKALAEDVKPGDCILLADELFELRVETVTGSEVGCTVIHGGTLGNNKGINLSGVNVSAPSLTEKDIEDAGFALDIGSTTSLCHLSEPPLISMNCAS